ncbi:MAG: tRNA 2-thiouridine(34) synthase MnmA [Gammaproteobacteria bacterium]|nr:tRNA 2-thiouridine(34) synthase MnmA [Gammaproteobacteria bacterium]
MTGANRVIVGLSGGVDSAVAALLLKREGYDVAGLFMKNWEEDDRDGHCTAAEDLQEVRRVCDTLHIPLHTVNFATEYWDQVFSTFLAELRAGRTPNPDVLCNKEIKFKAFLEHAAALGAHHIATGHYARIVGAGGACRLMKAHDREKDQTYFLHALGQYELARALFPLGGLTKTEVRTIARQARLPNHARRDSTGICFIGERNFRQFIARYLTAQPGTITTLDGAVKGRHDGLMFYTIGQRHGLGVGGPGEAWYVVGKNIDRNVLYIGQGVDHPALYAEGLKTESVHWISGEPPSLPLACRAKTRYRQPDQDCVLHRLPDGGVRVDFAIPQRAITPGQSAVFYRDEVCLGGGIILEASPNMASSPERQHSLRAGS